jgi:hypothetical protein
LRHQSFLLFFLFFFHYNDSSSAVDRCLPSILPSPSTLYLPSSIIINTKVDLQLSSAVASSTSIHQLFLSAFINRTHIIASCSLSTSKPPITGDITFNLTVTDTQIARVLTMKIGPPKHRDLDDRTGSLGQTPVDLSKNVSDMDVTGGNSFTMSEIKSLDAAPTPGVPLAISDTKISGEVPTAPEINNTVVRGALEGEPSNSIKCQSLCESDIQSASDDDAFESWIPVP